MFIPDLAIVDVRLPSGSEGIALARRLRLSGDLALLFLTAADAFLHRWPVPQAWADEPLAARLAADVHTRPFLTFVMLHGHLQPGYDWLARRKIQHLLRYAAASPLADDIAGYQQAAHEVGFSAHIVKRSAERVVLRLLIQTGRPLDALGLDDLGAIEEAFRARGAEPSTDWRNDRGLLHAAHAVLFHLGILEMPAPNRRRRHHDGFAHHFDDTPAQLRAVFAAYLERLVGTKAPSTVQGIGIRLAHFGRHLAATDPRLGSLAHLDRQRHIEPYLSAVAHATRSWDGQPISVGEQRSRIPGAFPAVQRAWQMRPLDGHQEVQPCDAKRDERAGEEN